MYFFEWTRYIHIKPGAVVELFSYCRFEIEVNWTGDLTLDEVLELFEREKKKNPNRYSSL